MLPIYLLPTVSAAINDTSISVNWVLIIVVGIVGALISILITILLNYLNSIKIDVSGIRKELHDFIASQTGFNERIEERTKDL